MPREDGRSHTVNEPFQTLPLRLACGQQVPDVLLWLWPVSKGKKKPCERSWYEK